jgi:RNA polymerase sigma-70 factor (ECF subfamily)
MMMESSIVMSEATQNYGAMTSLNRRAESKRKRPAGRSLASSPIKDSALIERLQNGDEDALEDLFNLYSPKLYNVAHKILGDVADTQEVIQDVFWTAYRKAKTFRGTAQLSTWLYRLTVNAALGKIRRSKKSKEVEYDEFLPKFEEDGHHAVRPVVDWSNALEEDCARREIQELLKQALDLLSPLDRSIVVLSDLEGLPDKEIAAAVSITVPAVKTRLHRARLFLRGKLAVSLGYSAA